MATKGQLNYIPNNTVDVNVFNKNAKASFHTVS